MSLARTKRLLLLINDLMFVSGLRVKAESAGWQVFSARNQAKLEQTLAEQGSEWDLILLDLDARSQYSFSSSADLAQVFSSQKHFAFYSHMDQQAYQAGKELGFTQIIARSKLEDNFNSVLTS